MVSIRYIAVLGFQPARARLWTRLPAVSIRYIAVLGFQPSEEVFEADLDYRFPSAISRYLVSNTEREILRTFINLKFPSAISRYLVSNTTLVGMTVVQAAVSIRYIAVLGFQPAATNVAVRLCRTGFHPLYRGTWFPTGDAFVSFVREVVSIRYIAVLGFQLAERSH